MWGSSDNKIREQMFVGFERRRDIKLKYKLFKEVLGWHSVDECGMRERTVMMLSWRELKACFERSNCGEHGRVQACILRSFAPVI